MVDLIDSGKLTVASATAFSLSPEYAEKMNDKASFYRTKIVLRPQEISNNPEVIRRLGVISRNGLLGADLYGNVQFHQRHGHEDERYRRLRRLHRNAFISTFVTPSTAKNGDISCIVPMVSHHDHTEHDVMVVITEQGLADLRGLSPKQRAQKIIDNCAHPDFRPRAPGLPSNRATARPRIHTPHLLTEALSWHQRMLDTGSMRVK